MSLDPKKFGLSPSLLETVKEALKGNQYKLDKNKNGKLDSQDFKMLRKEDAKPDYLDFDKDGNKKESMKKALADKKMKNEDKDKEQAVANEQTKADYDKANYKHGMMKEGPSEKDATNPKQGSSVDPKQRSIGEAAPAASGVADQMAAKKDALKTQIQRKIASKQMEVMKAKANKRLSSMKESDGGKKCSCGTTNESKMKCEVHGGKDKETKGGREAIVMNPPLKEASDLPKKVVSKGHEIAKSLIKHKSKVDNPYAVGMATAKKSAGIKEETTDESVYPERHAAAKKTLGRVAKEKGGKVGFQSTTYKDGKKVTTHGHYNEKGERVVTRTTNEEIEQVDELSRETKNAYIRKADKQVGVTMNQRPAKKIGGIGYANLHKIKNRKAGIKQAMKD
jgi:signal recognition particle subunit SEC65